MAGGLSLGPFRRGPALSPGPCGAHLLPCLAAMAGRSPARAGCRACPRRRTAHRSLSRPRRRRGWRRLRDLGDARALCPEALDGSAPGSPRTPGTGLGPAALQSSHPGGAGSRRLPRSRLGQYAPCRRHPHRPRFPAAAPLPDPLRRACLAGRLCGLPVRSDACRAARGEPPRAMPGDRGGPGHGTGRLLRCHHGFGRPELPRPALRADEARPSRSRANIRARPWP